MRPSLKYLGLVAILASSFIDAAKTPARRNMIMGTVISRSDSLANPSVKPVQNAIVRAYNLGGSEVIASPPTAADGKFAMVVPQSYKQFKIEVHQKDALFWDYKPDEEILNQGHPHDLGTIVLKTTSRLSQAEMKTQVDAAKFLATVGDSSASSLLDKVTDAFLKNFRRPAINSCPGAPVPHSINVSYRVGGDETTGSDLPDTPTQKLVNLRITVRSMKRFNALEERFFALHHYYADYDDLERAKLALQPDFEPPGYCIELITGQRNGKVFQDDPEKREKPNYYILFATPHLWGRTGEFYVYSDPSKAIRFTNSREGLSSLDEAEKATDLFPLDLAIFKDKPPR